MNTVSKTRDMVLTGAFVAIMLIMTIIPVLGYIPLGFMNATIIHIPVIIGAILMGPRKGAFLGFVFGLTSMWKNTILMPNPTSFVFSPFITVGDFSGNWRSVVICMIPRILIGVVAYYVYKAVLRSNGKKQILALTCAGVAGSITNTLLVMNLIYFLFGNSYAAAAHVNTAKGVYAFILGVICMNGIPEAILAGILTAAITRVLIQVKEHS
ncbi:ECF transporter S component [Clostridium sp. AM58-1XD]|uniref:ECF transporter S component n=1 Tax=Clostridium sp. AM58-1XD TaxID=2292307 RepID=UPI000E498DDD|nr:ECF transporter S component [Clostridium sp. AM58-1XD]RGY95581.1 ECF transporter S component [Clostridium sp. AM58-1XD]